MTLIHFLIACIFVTIHAAPVHAEEDIDECAADPSYAETMNKAVSNVRFNNLQPSIPLDDTLMPMCRNLRPDQNSNQTGYDPRIKGFECTCPPPTVRTVFALMKRFGFSCPSAGCPNCRTKHNYECVDNKCQCKHGYSERFVNKTAQCVQRECGDGEVFPPQLMASKHQLRVTCDKQSNRFIANPGYRLVRDNVTHVVTDSVDIDECKEQPDICCANESKCTGPNCVKCMNSIGSYSCGSPTIVCEKSHVDKDTCKCQGLACNKKTTWYADCNGEPTLKNLDKTKRVCSRIIDQKNNKLMSFYNDQALFDYSVKYKCDCCFLAAQPSKFSLNPVVNYYGPCQDKAEQVLCPNGARATTTDVGPWCAINAKIFDLPAEMAGAEIGHSRPDPQMSSPLPGVCVFMTTGTQMNILTF